MALDARVTGGDGIEAGWINDVAASGTGRVIAAGSVTALASDVPFGHGVGGEVVVHGMAAVAEGAGRALHIVGGIVGHPPIGVVRDEIGTPDLVRNVPLRPQRKIIVTDLRKVTLFPDAAVNESDVFFFK